MVWLFEIYALRSVGEIGHLLARQIESTISGTKEWPKKPHFCQNCVRTTRVVEIFPISPLQKKLQKAKQLFIYFSKTIIK